MDKEEEIIKLLKTLNSIMHILGRSLKREMKRYFKNLIR